jgi:hypothetical protein
LIRFCLLLSGCGRSSKEAGSVKVTYINHYKSRNFDQLENHQQLTKLSTLFTHSHHQ